MKKEAIVIYLVTSLVVLLLSCTPPQETDRAQPLEAEEIPVEETSIEKIQEEVQPSLPDEQTLRTICARERYPADCNQIPFASGVAICAKCKELGFTYEEPYGQQASTRSSSSSLPNTQTNTDKFITANPLDLSQIEKISKFRSCEGHDYSGLNTNGEQETLRSMKHYVNPPSRLVGAANGAKIFAPFDGKVAELRDTSPGKYLFIAADAAPQWNFIFFHVDLLPGIQAGTTLRAGQHLGYASAQIQRNFDMGLKEFGRRGQIFDSPFSHMEEAVLAEYKAKGVTPENIIVTKQTRDADPCRVYGTRPEGDADFGQSKEESFVRIR